MKKGNRYQSIIAWFSTNLPDAQTELIYRNPFELLVAVILSAQCTDKRVNMTTPSIFAKYPTPQTMAKASVEDMLKLVKSISYPNSKAAHLVGMAQMLVTDFGGQIPDDMNKLQKLPGVGRKTANVMMIVAFGHPAMPVDTHVFRVAHRIGLVTEKATTPLETERQLVANFPSTILSKAHHWLILHGRYTCVARKPKCENCGVREYCAFASSQIKK